MGDSNIGVEASLKNLAWSDYWSKGGISSFAGTNYEGVIKRYWLDVADHIESDSNVIDLCTGNGALLEILSSRAKANFIGVDYAKVNPLGDNKYTLIGECSIDNLPYKDNFFSLAVSQFGVEYSNLAESTKEIARVLDYDGKFKFICHKKNSFILQNNFRIFQCSRKLIDCAFPVFSEMLRGLDLTARGQGQEKGDAIASGNRQKFNESMSQIHQEFGDIIHDTGFPDAMKRILAENKSGDLSMNFERFKASFDAAQQRLEHLFAVGLDEAGEASFVRLLSDNDLTLNVFSPIVEQGVGVLGIVVEGVKSRNR